MVKYDYFVVDVKKALGKGKFSVSLKVALNEILLAVKSKDYSLLADLTGVKSYIADVHNHKNCVFYEDSTYNNKSLGFDLYGLLDDFHHRVSMDLGQMPSGMMVLNASGIKQRGVSKHSSPTLNAMKKEHEQILKEAKEKYG